MPRLLALLVLLAACLQPGYPVKAPAAFSLAEAVLGTHQVRVNARIGANEGWVTGTAWVASVADGDVKLVTAGHVCALGDDVTITGVTLISANGREVPATVLRVDAFTDLCLLGTTKSAGGALPLAPADPTYGTAVGYVGSPHGIWGDGRVPLYFGHYAGGDMITAPVAPGASGSAVWSDAGVIGVVVRVRTGFPQAAFIVSRAQLAAFLAE